MRDGLLRGEFERRKAHKGHYSSTELRPSSSAFISTAIILLAQTLTQNPNRWDEGLLDMCIGEKRKLTIAPEMGYGQRAMGPIPAGSMLIFETELVGIKGVERDEL